MAQFDSPTPASSYDCVGVVDLSESGEVVVEIGLNCEQTHLVALTCSIVGENEDKNFLRVYDLRTLNFGMTNSDQVIVLTFLTLSEGLICLGWLNFLLTRDILPSVFPELLLSYPMNGLFDLTR